MLKAKFKDTPERWAIFDRWHEAYLWGALNNVFNLKEDAKVNKAFDKNDLATVKEITAKRLKAVGSKPKFKKVPDSKRGLSARAIKGSMAYAGMLYEQKLHGKPKVTKRGEIAAKSNETKKPQKVKKIEKPNIERKPLSPVNPDLPQNDAYTKARKKAKPGENLLYVVHREDLQFTAVYYNKKTKKRRKLAITAVHVPRPDPAEERMTIYAAKVKDRLDEKARLRAIEIKKKKRLEKQNQASAPVKAKKKKKSNKRM